ncbi:MAG: NAD(P)-dependent oxidoreductase, partial [Cellulomonadaceae bacterium]
EGEPRLPADVRAVRYDPDQPVPDELLGAQVLVTWGNPPELVADAARRMTGLRLVQTLAAGPDVALAAGFAPDVTIASGRGLHDATVTEHTLALLLATLRRVPQMVHAQDAGRWAGELGGLQPLHPAGQVRTLIGARVLVWGFGSIGQRLAPVLSALGASVTGGATRAGSRGGFPVLDDDGVRAHLPETDVLISVLPDLPSTRGVLDASVFSALPDRAVVVNVGRGAVLDEAALQTALESGSLGAAALDVFATEPLPQGSPLWSCPNLLISPHAAGGRPVGADELVAHNVVALAAGEPLRNVVRAGS